MTAPVSVYEAAPPRLPVDHLSVSSLRTWLQCQERWRRRYILGEFEPSSPPALLGSAVHRAEGASYQAVVDGERLHPVERVVDEFRDELALQIERAGEIEWEDEKPGRVVDTGVLVVRHYHQHVPPRVRPISVERRYDVVLPGVYWTFRGYLDLETQPREGDPVEVNDLKVRSPSKGVISEAEAAADLQATGNLWAQRAEGRQGSRFGFHNLVRPPKKAPLSLRHVAITPTHRTPDELDTFTELVYRAAVAIDRAAQNDSWMPAPPGAWWCAPRFCGFWASCAFGGAHRSALSPGGPRPIARPTDSMVMQAVRNTRLKNGQTTAAKVAVDLGITVAEASGRLQSLERQGLVRGAKPTKASGRGKDRVIVEVAGARRYSIPDPPKPQEVPAP